jgi:hypothetical protein
VTLTDPPAGTLAGATDPAVVKLGAGAAVGVADGGVVAVGAGVAEGGVEPDVGVGVAG